MISNEMWDNTQPEPISLRNTAPWVWNKFEITMMISRKQQHYRKRGYKLFEDW